MLFLHSNFYQAVEVQMVLTYKQNGSVKMNNISLSLMTQQILWIMLAINI